jgi:hypothetical protein
VRVLIDSSAWIEFLNGNPSRTAEEVSTAEEHGCSVLARDRDLEAILGSGLLKASLVS